MFDEGLKLESFSQVYDKDFSKFIEETFVTSRMREMGMKVFEVRSFRSQNQNQNQSFQNQSFQNQDLRDEKFRSRNPFDVIPDKVWKRIGYHIFRLQKHEFLTV